MNASMTSSPKPELPREVSRTQWRLLQAGYIIGAGLLVAPAYPLLEGDLDLLAALYGALVIVTLTRLRHRVLARVSPPPGLR